MNLTVIKYAIAIASIVVAIVIRLLLNPVLGQSYPFGTKRHNHIRLEVQDWGVGFDSGDAADHRGGLKGFAERVRLAGGELTIGSSTGNGTPVIVELPVLQVS